MKRRLLGMIWMLAIPMLWLAAAQNQFPGDDRGSKLKRSQVEALLKQEHEKSLEDAAELVKLSEELKVELEKSDRHVLSLKAVKQTEEIEKLAKRIRGRMRRF